MSALWKSRPAPLLWLLALLLLLSGARFGLDLKNGLAFERGQGMFTDLLVFRASVRSYEMWGKLYATDRPAFFRPGSGVYKYPPPYASLLLHLPYEKMSILVKVVGWTVAACYLAALILMVAAVRPPPIRGLGLCIILLNWYPFRESMMGPQLEPFILLLLVLTLAGLRSGTPSAAPWRAFLSGIPVGIAGAFKVYPGLVAVFGLFLRRGRQFLLGVAAGAAAALAGSALLMGSSRTLIQYFTEVLPDLGGTLLRWDNISLPANLGRLFILAARGSEAAAKAAQPRAMVLEAAGLEGIRAAVMVSGFLITAFLAWHSIRAYRRTRTGIPATSLGFGAAVCLLLFLIPTSWPDYQTLLALPLFLAVHYLPGWREDPLTWILVGAAALAGVTPASMEVFENHAFLVTALRSWMPLFLWWALVRLMRQGGPVGSGRDLPRPPAANA